MIPHEHQDLLRYRQSLHALIVQYVPDGKSIDTMLENLAQKWNPLVDLQQRRNLLADVNALARDYLRPIRRSFFTRPPDSKRVRSLAEQLSASKGLVRITKKDSLVRYLELYLLKCLDSVS